MVFNNFLFQVLKINPVLSLGINKLIDCQLPLVDQNRSGKRIVDRLLHKDRISFCGQGADGSADSIYNTGRFHQPFGLNLPVETAGKPMLQNLKIISFSLRVAEDPMLALIDQGVNHTCRSLKIHVGNPERKDLLRLLSLFGKVVFQRIGVAAVNNFIKIILQSYSSNVCLLM